MSSYFLVSLRQYIYIFLMNKDQKYNYCANISYLNTALEELLLEEGVGEGLLGLLRQAGHQPVAVQAQEGGDAPLHFISIYYQEKEDFY